MGEQGRKEACYYTYYAKSHTRTLTRCQVTTRTEGEATHPTNLKKFYFISPRLHYCLKCISGYGANIATATAIYCDYNNDRVTELLKGISMYWRYTEGRGQNQDLESRFTRRLAALTFFPMPRVGDGAGDTGTKSIRFGDDDDDLSKSLSL